MRTGDDVTVVTEAFGPAASILLVPSGSARSWLIGARIDIFSKAANLSAASDSKRK